VVAEDEVASPELPIMPSFRLDGRRALVTGAGRGIGAAIAAALSQAGAEVQLIARSRAEIEQVAASLRRRGGQAEAITLDVTDSNKVHCVLGTQPAYDILVNNAGTNRPKPMQAVTADDFDVVFGLNVRAAYFVSQIVVAQMLAANRGGSIIHISSQMGHVGAPHRSLYCASKHALEGLTKAMAIELAPAGIRVNSIAPTFIETPLTRPYLENEDFRASVLAKIKLGRLGRGEDLMGAVVYLASDASSLVTGTSLIVDGGWTAE
jgi:NAD(P)-dependent dehydrogenase (short-subunit alcohol dehydrogenase family)